MAFLTDLYTYLISKSNVTNVVGNRVYPGLAPNSAQRPYIIYDVVEYDNARTTSGPSTYAETTVQFEIIGTFRSEVDSGSTGLRNVLDGYRGTMGSEDIRHCKFESEFEDTDIQGEAGNETQIHRRTVNYLFGRVQALPTATP